MLESSPPTMKEVGVMDIEASPDGVTTKAENKTTDDEATKNSSAILDSSIYEGMDDGQQGNDDDDDLGLSSISTSGDLYDDAVMGLLLGGDEEGLGLGGLSQKTIDSTGSDEVFRGPSAEGDGVDDDGDEVGCRIVKLEGSLRGRGGNAVKMHSSLGSGEEILNDEGFVGSWEGNRKTGLGRFAFYVGNLTWWTTHDDIKKACKLVGALDVVDIKVQECRANGQSKGYALVILSSEESLKMVTDQLDKTEIHGRIPVVKPDAKSSALYFDSLSKTRPPPPTSTSSSGSIGSILGDHPVSGYGGPITTTRNNSNSSNGGGALMATPYVGGGSIGSISGRYPPRQPYHRNFGIRNGGGLLPGPPPSRPPWGSHNQHYTNRYSPRMSNSMYHMPPRGPPPPLSSVVAASSSSYGLHHQHQHHHHPGPRSYDEWRGQESYVPRVHFNPAFLNRLPLFQNEDYNNLTSSSSTMTTMMDEGISYYHNHPPPPLHSYPSSQGQGGSSYYTNKQSHPSEYEDHHHQLVRQMSPEERLSGTRVAPRPLSAASQLSAADEILPQKPSSAGAVIGDTSLSQPITSSSAYAITSSSSSKEQDAAENKPHQQGGASDSQELDVDELLERNNSICSQAIQRAVNDASNGEYASSIETLVTAISLIRGSKVARDKRCQVLICSLQESLEGIEHRSYGRQKSERFLVQESSSKGSYSGSRRSPPPIKSSRSQYYYDRSDSSGRYYSHHHDSKDRSSSSSRRRTWDERGGDDLVERDPRGSKVCRMEDGRDCYRR